MGNVVRKAVLHFLNSGILDTNINTTYIALIPKASPATKVFEFRPFSICNVLYKFIAKVMANHLKKVLPSIISCNQSAFIPSRFISNNVLVAYEALHTMHTKKKREERVLWRSNSI